MIGRRPSVFSLVLLNVTTTAVADGLDPAAILKSTENGIRAHPLQYGYPATPPHVGDYLTVNDALPTPQPGSGYYYVTAATYQGQTRFGRKTSGGKLSGRDPALLTGCGTGN